MGKVMCSLSHRSQLVQKIASQSAMSICPSEAGGWGFPCVRRGSRQLRE